MPPVQLSGYFTASLGWYPHLTNFNHFMKLQIRSWLHTLFALQKLAFFPGVLHLCFGFDLCVLSYCRFRELWQALAQTLINRNVENKRTLCITDSTGNNKVEISMCNSVDTINVISSALYIFYERRCVLHIYSLVLCVPIFFVSREWN